MEIPALDDSNLPCSMDLNDQNGSFSTGRDAMAPIWLVVGGEQTGGIVVRAGAA